METVRHPRVSSESLRCSRNVAVAGTQWERILIYIRLCDCNMERHKSVSRGYHRITVQTNLFCFSVKYFKWCFNIASILLYTKSKSLITSLPSSRPPTATMLEQIHKISVTTTITTTENQRVLPSFCRKCPFQSASMFSNSNSGLNKKPNPCHCTHMHLILKTMHF